MGLQELNNAWNADADITMVDEDGDEVVSIGDTIQTLLKKVDKLESEINEIKSENEPEGVSLDTVDWSPDGSLQVTVEIQSEVIPDLESEE